MPYSAIISLVIGVICLLTRGWPLVLPVIGLAFAAHALMKSRRRSKARLLGVVSAALNGIVVVLMLLTTYR